jgi:glycosyltransferase involved in cell wall biosynthesis
MKICLVSRSIPIHVPGGFEKYIFDVAFGLTRRGHEVHVITKRLPKDRVGEEIKEMNGVHLHYVGPRSTRFWYSVSFFIEMGKRLAELDNECHFDIIHSNNLSAFSMSLIRPSNAWPPLVTTAHGTATSEYLSHARGVFKKVVGSIRFLPPVIPEYVTFARSMKIIAVAPRVKLQVEQMCKKLGKKDLVIFNGIDERLFHPDDQSSRHETVTILYTGNVSASKGVPTLYRVFKRLCVKYPRLRLRVVGGGPYLSELRNQVHSDHLEKVVRLDGYTAPSMMPGIYRQGDIFVLPTESQEGFSFSILEALATALPTIASSDCHVAHLFDKHHCGLVYPARDEARLSGLVESLVNKSELRESLGRAGRELVLKRFTVDRMIDGIERTYQRVIDLEKINNRTRCRNWCGRHLDKCRYCGEEDCRNRLKQADDSVYIGKYE